MVDLVPPTEWSAHPGRYAAMLGEDRGHRMEGWVLHWPGTPDVQTVGAGRDVEIARLRSYERYHLSLGWRGIAYDYAVGQSGTAYRLRGTGQSGATSGDYDEDGVPNNRETDAVLFIVGLDEKVTPAAIRTFVRLVDQLGGPRRDVLGHTQASSPRGCPGPYVLAGIVAPAQNWPKFRATTTTTPPPEPEEFTVTPEDAKQIAGIVDDRIMHHLFTKSYMGGKDLAERIRAVDNRTDNLTTMVRGSRTAVDRIATRVEQIARDAGLSAADVAKVKAAVAEGLVDGVDMDITITQRD